MQLPCRHFVAALWLGAAALGVGGCNGNADQPSSSTSGAPATSPATRGAHDPPTRKITIGLVAKSQSNAVFQAAFAGAKDAARELGPQYGVEVTIDWETPADEDAQKQVEAIDQLSSGGAAGIAVSCTDANTLTPAIDRAVERGTVVMCFDSDAPKSKRLCYYGTDDITCGQRVMGELAEVMGDQGTIAILGGNQTAPNLQKRRDGVLEELKKHPNMKLLSPDGVFYHKETPEDAVVAINTAQSTHPAIQGWALIGGWPLFTRDALKWAPGSVKVVSVDALPAELSYLEDGHVQALYGQDCYGWGHKSVEILLDKIVKGQNPPQDRIIDPLTRVTKDNAAAFAAKWDKWLGKETKGTTVATTQSGR